MDDKPHGWFWEVIHEASGDIVNDGYSRRPIKEGPVDIKGFVLHSTPVYTLENSRAVNNAVIRFHRRRAEFEYLSWFPIKES